MPEIIRCQKRYLAREVFTALRRDSDGIVIALRTVTKILRNLQLNRRRFIDPNGENNSNHRSSSRTGPGRLACPQ